MMIYSLIQLEAFPSSGKLYQLKGQFKYSLLPSPEQHIIFIKIHEHDWRTEYIKDNRGHW